MAGRTVISFILRMISSLVLARLLFPQDYGAFGVVAGITGISMILCDVGLSGALMHQDSDPTDDENITVFLSQQLLTSLVVAGIIFVSPWLMRSYNMPARSYPLLICMALSLFLSSLRVIPMMFLERTLRFRDIAKCELLENVVQVFSTITLAYLGFGAWSLAGGGILRGIAGMACIWYVSPWRPCGQFDIAVIRRLARYGLPLQLNYLVPALGGSWYTFAVSRLLGVAAVGFVGWAMNIASVPMMFTSVLSRVAFPAYSRLQSNPEMLGYYLRMTIKQLVALCCVVVPVAVILCPLVLPLLFKHRWVPAIPLVQWFTLESVVAMLLGVLCAAQNALGYPKDRLVVTVLMTIVRWTMGCIAVAQYGLVGIGPVMLALTMLELLITCIFIVIRRKQLAGIFTVVFVPLSGVGAILAVTMWVGHFLIRTNVIWQQGVTLAMFATCLLLWECLANESVVWKDLLKLLRSMRNLEHTRL